MAGLVFFNMLFNLVQIIFMGLGILCFIKYLKEKKYDEQ